MFREVPGSRRERAKWKEQPRSSRTSRPDEATFALHVRGEAEVMAVIAPERPDDHHHSRSPPELEAFHQRKLTIAHRPVGATIVQDGPTPARQARKVSNVTAG